MNLSQTLIEFASAALIGAREEQEDCQNTLVLGPQGAARERLLVVLADGMGGEAGGEVASATAVAAFIAAAGKHAARTAEEVLALGMGDAAMSVADTARRTRGADAMGTTLVAIVFETLEEGTRLLWISIGDSPLWRIDRTGSVVRLNEDHSLAGELTRDVQSGALTPADAEFDPRRDQHNVLTRVLDGRVFDSDSPDFRREPLTLDPGDVILVASDGIETLTEEALGRIIVTHGKEALSAIAARLLGAVSDLAAEHQDNVTFTLVRRLG